MLDEWKTSAKESGLSVSKFVVETVERALRDEGKGPRYSRRDLINQNRSYEKELQKLKEDHRLKSRAYESLERENQGLRLQVFQHPGMSGLKQMDKELLDLFREKKRLSYDEILPELGIDSSDFELLRSLRNQLLFMVQLGIIKPDFKGWKWIG